MLRPRIERIELERPPLAGAWDLAAGRPTVIAGPNGSGKTSLLEAIIECLYGTAYGTPWSRDSAGDARRDHSRGWCSLRITRGDDRYEVRRELDTGSVRVSALADGAILFQGRGDPRARTAEGERYRQLLADLVGVADLDTYGRTLFVRQGTLPFTRLGDHLLKVAAGGHRRVEAAWRQIAESHRAITARPLHPGDRAAVDPRALERADAEITSVRDRLEAARAAGARRGPLALDRERMGERLRRLSEEIDVLEEAHAALARGSVIEVSARQLKDLVRRLRQAAEEMPAGAGRLDRAEAEARRRLAGGRYPPDLPQRLAQASLRWRDLDALDGRPSRWLAAIPLLLLVAAAVLFVTDTRLLFWVPWAVAGAAVAAAAVWAAIRVDVGRTRGRLQRELEEILAAVPGGDTLVPDSADTTVRRFTAQTDAVRRREQARQEMAATLRSARRLLRGARAAGIRPQRDEQAGTADRERAAAVVLEARLRSALKLAEDRLSRERRELDRVGDASLRLPDGVVPTEAGVAESLRERREERRRLQENLQELGQELLERGTPAESVDALEAALAGLSPRRDELARKAEVFEAAHALLTDAYDAFRRLDQDRLVGLVSGYAGRLTDGGLGPLVVEEGLEKTRVRAGDRLLELQSPPLSFGQLHALFLAVRLGAAQFLGGLGVFPPLILDEPFAHLDPDHSAAAWELLGAVARERQVIITTQDSLLLPSLGVEPDIRLAAAEPDTAEPQQPAGVPGG
jgi:energy-coupling factor transporter ATP-binding protein EcfA2